MHHLAGLALVCCAAADPTFGLGLDQPAATEFPGNSTLTYVFTARAGSEDERFHIRASTPLLRDGGSPLGGPAEATVDPPFEFLGRGHQIAHPFCSAKANRFHGYEPSVEQWLVGLPAGAAGTLRMTYRVGAFNPWPRADLRLRVRVDSSMGPEEQGTLSQAYELVSPAPRVRLRRSGVRIRLSVRPAARRAGRPLRVRGTTWPELRRQRVALRYFGPGAQRRLRTLAFVRTDRAGRFRYRWTPATSGRYELWAFYRSQRRGYVSDHACPRLLRVVP
jgi:hypothetical protein